MDCCGSFRCPPPWLGEDSALWSGSYADCNILFQIAAACEQWVSVT